MAWANMTIQDLVSGSAKSNNKDPISDTFLPFLLLPTLLLIATISYVVTIIVMVAIVMGVLYVYSRPRQKNRSPFFFSWTLASFTTLFLAFDLAVLKLQEITLLENLTFLVLVACTCYFFHKMKSVAQIELVLGPCKGKEYSPVITSDSKYCPICQIEVNERYFHSIWWDCCVFRPNYPYFLLGQVFAFLVLLVGTNLGLTTVCQPFVLFGPILLPEDCTGVYDGFWTAISFVSCIYGLGYLVVIALVLLQQLFVIIPKYSEPQWRRLINVRNV